jgi:hypothetical protein
LIKKIDGDRRRLLEDIVGSLSIAREDVRINPTTQHIELKVRMPRSDPIGIAKTEKIVTNNPCLCFREIISTRPGDGYLIVVSKCV